MIGTVVYIITNAQQFNKRTNNNIIITHMQNKQFNQRTENRDKINFLIIETKQIQT